jgi:Tfp pilus assembly protein PilO
MSEPLYLLSIGLMFGTVLVIFGMKYFSSARQAQARIAIENSSRELAQKAVTAQSENAASLSAIRAELAEIKTRLTAVEKILKEVE